MIAKTSNLGYLKNFFSNIDSYITRAIYSSILKKPSSYHSMVRLARTYLSARTVRASLLVEGVKVPPILILGVTSSCNLSCKGCYAAATGTLAPCMKNKSLSLKEWEEIINQATELGVFGFIIAGGEPFLVQDVLSICTSFKDRIFAFFTNGTMLKTKDLKRLKKLHNAIIMVSIEGDQELTNQRRGHGVYEKAISLISSLNKNKIMSGVSITINKLNYRYWMQQKNLDDLISNGIKLAFFLEYVPVENDSTLMLSNEERKEFRDIILRYRRKNKILILHSPGDEELKGGCVSAGRSFAYITPRGDLTPCPVSNIATHNLKTSSLKEGLGSPLFSIIREQDYLLETENSPCALFSHKKEVDEILKKVNGYYTCS
ncbi:MAG: radical SAM protein [Candidatus Lokiarchaeota archaeon]|nr:radical SAM protein [Candidatus Lokiarchaeota archaeon]